MFHSLVCSRAATARTALPRDGAACREGALESDPADCARYLFCVHGAMERYSCQRGTAWDNALKVCNFPDQVDCSSSSSSTEAAPAQAPASPAPPPQIQSGVVLVVGDRDAGDYNSNDYSEYNSYSDYSDTSNDVGDVAEFQPNPESGLSGDYKIVCYFTNWAWYRPGRGKFRAEDVEADLCTHIVYGFAVLDSSTLTIKPHDTWADIDNSE